MAKRYENAEGFLIIEMTPYEAVHKCNFGAETDKELFLICDNCNKLLNDYPNLKHEVYYVAILNRLFCKECLEHWYSYAARYKEDIAYEVVHYNMYADVLNLTLESMRSEYVHYEEQTTDIHGEVFDKDFDEVGWEPEVIDDSDEEAANAFGY